MNRAPRSLTALAVVAALSLCMPAVGFAEGANCPGKTQASGQSDGTAAAAKKKKKKKKKRPSRQGQGQG